MSAIKVNSYRFLNVRELSRVECNRADFIQMARAHCWRESVIALLIKEPLVGEFKMGAYWVKLTK